MSKTIEPTSPLLAALAKYTASSEYGAIYRELALEKARDAVAELLPHKGDMPPWMRAQLAVQFSAPRPPPSWPTMAASELFPFI